MRWPGKSQWMKWLEQRPVLSRSLAGLLVALAVWALVERDGIGAGIFSLVVIVMGIGCLVVVLFPYRYLNMFSLALIYLAALACEYFIV